MMAYQYRAKKPFFIAYMALLLIGILLTIGRWLSVVDPGFVLIHADVHAHLSNFSLSLIVYLGIGYSWLLSGMKFRFVALLGALLIAGNFACETLMGFMNTTDIVDALYGTVGIVLVFVYLLLLKKRGLLALPTKPPS